MKHKKHIMYTIEAKDKNNETYWFKSKHGKLTKSSLHASTMKAAFRKANGLVDKGLIPTIIRWKSTKKGWLTQEWTYKGDI